jgi:hypothetical protein
LKVEVQRQGPARSRSRSRFDVEELEELEVKEIQG